MRRVRILRSTFVFAAAVVVDVDLSASLSLCQSLLSPSYRVRQSYDDGFVSDFRRVSDVSDDDDDDDDAARRTVRCLSVNFPQLL